MSNKIKFFQEYPLSIEQDVLWGDMDAFQHVNNAVYFRYFEDIRLNFFEKTSVMSYMNTHKIGPILASTQCQFRAPLTYPDHIHIAARLHSTPAAGDKRFTMEYAVYSDQQDCIVAKGEGLVVYYDYSKNESCEIPDTIRESFSSM